MTSVCWLTRSLADVPVDDGWLGPAETEVLAGLRFPKRRADWRVGRFTAKAAVAAQLGVPVSRVEIIAAPDGAPEPRVDGGAAPIALSLSHRADRALAVVGEPGVSLGCDLELIEPRSPAFVGDWLAPEERAVVAGAGAHRDLAANLLWTAKEAAAKVLREGLRVDVRRAVATPEGLGCTSTRWRPLTIVWEDGSERVAGWWLSEPGWVMAVAGQPPPSAPEPLPSD